MFLKSISFNDNVTFESNRDEHAKMFKIKTKKYIEKDLRKPIYHPENHSRIGYKEREVTEKTFTIFKKGLKIDFNSNITIIVGDNGCGKTSLINNLIYPSKKINDFIGLMDISKEDYEKEVISKWLNNKKRQLEFIKSPEFILVGKDIHKTSIIDNYQKTHTDYSGFMPAQHLVNMWDMQTFSNGENNLDFLYMLTGMKNALIVLDEPETSLSIKSQYKIINLIKELSKDNQLIIITHNENIMRLNEQVYDFEKKKYVNTEKYITLQKKI